jgi:hypothetical protein
MRRLDRETNHRANEDSSVRVTQQCAKRSPALVKNDHSVAMPFWEAVGYRVDERIIRRVRNL